MQAARLLDQERIVAPLINDVVELLIAIKVRIGIIRIANFLAQLMRGEQPFVLLRAQAPGCEPATNGFEFGHDFKQLYQLLRLELGQGTSPF